MLLPETGAAYSAPLSSTWFRQLFSSVYSAGSWGRLYSSSGEKVKPQLLTLNSKSRPNAARIPRWICCLMVSSSLRRMARMVKSQNLTDI